MNEKEQVRTASGINLLAGIWLVLAPTILGYTGTAAGVNDVLLGVIVGILAIFRLSTPLESGWLSWVNALAGVWLILSPFVLVSAGLGALWNDIILGVIVAVLAVWSASAAANGMAARAGHRHVHATH